MTSSKAYPNKRSAPGFQISATPSAVVHIMASSKSLNKTSRYARAVSADSKLSIPLFTCTIYLAEDARSVNRVQDRPSPGLLLIILDVQLHYVKPQPMEA